MQNGDTGGANVAMGDAKHLISDSFAHTTREDGYITHIQCYNCSGSEDDHQHPPEKVGDQPSPEWEGSVSAVADYELLMKGAGAMTDQQFNGAIHLFINRYVVQAIKEE